MSTTDKPISTRLVNERKHLMSKILEDMTNWDKDMSDFIEYFKSNATMYEQMPVATKKKSEKEMKPQELKAVTAWSVYCKEFIDAKKEAAFKKNDKKKEPLRKFDVIAELRTAAAEEWKSGKVDTDSYASKAETYNKENCDTYRNVYSTMNTMLPEVIKSKLQSEDYIKKNMKKRELIHMMGCTGMYDKVDQCTKVKTMRTELRSYYKENCV